jgi:uncharacterized protein
MIRSLLLILLIFLIWRLIRIFKDKKPLRRITKTDVMVSCEHCGVYIPKDEAFYLDQHYYCCRAHYEENRSKNS